ncbi:hypothetical protein NUSPORA_01150 [Nucleospora cyclopteri]
MINIFNSIDFMFYFVNSSEISWNNLSDNISNTNNNNNLSSQIILYNIDKSKEISSSVSLQQLPLDLFLNFSTSYSSEISQITKILLEKINIGYKKGISIEIYNLVSKTPIEILCNAVVQILTKMFIGSLTNNPYCLFVVQLIPSLRKNNLVKLSNNEIKKVFIKCFQLMPFKMPKNDCYAKNLIISIACEVLVAYNWIYMLIGDKEALKKENVENVRMFFKEIIKHLDKYMKLIISREEMSYLLQSFFYKNFSFNKLKNLKGKKDYSNIYEKLGNEFYENHADNKELSNQDKENNNSDLINKNISEDTDEDNILNQSVNEREIELFYEQQKFIEGMAEKIIETSCESLNNKMEDVSYEISNQVLDKEILTVNPRIFQKVTNKGFNESEKTDLSIDKTDEKIFFEQALKNEVLDNNRLNNQRKNVFETKLDVSASILDQIKNDTRKIITSEGEKSKINNETNRLNNKMPINNVFKENIKVIRKNFQTDDINTDSLNQNYMEKTYDKSKNGPFLIDSKIGNKSKAIDLKTNDIVSAEYTNNEIVLQKTINPTDSNEQRMPIKSANTKMACPIENEIIIQKLHNRKMPSYKNIDINNKLFKNTAILNSKNINDTKPENNNMTKDNILEIKHFKKKSSSTNKNPIKNALKNIVLIVFGFINIFIIIFILLCIYNKRKNTVNQLMIK